MAQGRAGAVGARSVSDLLDQIVADARRATPGGACAPSSGTIDIDSSDPLLTGADDVLRALFDASLGTPDARERGPCSLRHAASKKSAVADLAAAVADTHAILFHAAGGRGLGPKAAAMFERCERQQAVIYVPVIVMWEVSLLARVSRVNLRRTVRGFFDDLFSNPSYQPFDMTRRADLHRRRAALQPRSVRSADLRGGACVGPAAVDPRRRHPRCRCGAGDLVVSGHRRSGCSSATRCM